MKIGIVSDHGGYILKKKLILYLVDKYEVMDYGTNSEESVDYPDFAFKLGSNLINKSIDFGIAICKTGIGMSIALNKVHGVLCVKADSTTDSLYARKHNNANAIAISGALSFRKAKKIIDKFLTSNFEIEERHLKRIEKIKDYENEC
ncbi:MAG: RpiB/LacA/LacB family sugar-phosphate isomerase [Tenericutes bacterium]|nr:RpiB/LacA/LacB family sugar-phosphate isomerase [Bacilli bacterium]MDD4624444.1 RpiB/LacA/LacB family sugar-phosphate isomerase [Bacilli bacterium]MDD4831776.1 RpiB/LacA/LacB family sugar-phosphate isomerase [Bacilli bacterium]NLV89901.1 RpiB/LacA/LacB family sugar-phosphate isomerase [Mycoplasmatota bacterium]